MYRLVTSPVVLCGCEHCAVILRDEHWLEVSENRVLRDGFGSKYQHSDKNCIKSLMGGLRLIRPRHRWTGRVGRINM